MPSGTDLLLNGLDLLLEAIDSCLGVEHMGDRLAGLREAGRLGSGSSWPSVALSR